MKWRGKKWKALEMTKAEKFCNSVQNEVISDGVLLAKASTASGQDPEKYVSVRTEGAGEWYFNFDDGSVLAMDIIEPGLRCLTPQVPVKR